MTRVRDHIPAGDFAALIASINAFDEPAVERAVETIARRALAAKRKSPFKPTTQRRHSGS